MMDIRLAVRCSHMAKKKYFGTKIKYIICNFNSVTFLQRFIKSIVSL